MHRSPTAPIFLLALLGTAAATTAGATAQESPPEDRTLARVVVADDSTQSYAVFLPDGYSAESPAPVLLLMDPRGRALVPLRLFRPAADALGYVVLSSYTTSSDEPTSARDTYVGVEAMLNDALARFTLDTSRLVLVGFSGTARIGWGMAVGLGDHVAGLIGFGGGFVRAVDPLLLGLENASFAYFGGAGTGDFNNAFVRRMDGVLDDTPIRHRIRVFPGRHQWPPVEVAREAVEWMEVQAQRAGLAPPDTGWVDERYRSEVRIARELEAGDRLHDAWLRYRQAAEGYEGLVDVSAAADGARRLARTSAVRGTAERVERWDAWEREARREAVVGAIEALRRPDPPTLDALVSIADVRRLRQQAEGRDTLAAQAATRVLASLMAQASFYMPRELLAADRPGHALRSLELASRIGGGRAAVCHRWRALPAALRERSEPLTAACAP